MYVNMGIGMKEMAFYTGWLYLPWVIKPFWSPFVDLIKNEKMVGIDNAVCYSYLYGGRGDNAAVKLFLRFNIISVLDYGILFSHTRYCG